jgi:D-glycero-D-manno-heptose 1,7-bisphosphate phosphatase
VKPAVFLDRDNTLIHDPGYLRDPAQVRLLDGAAEAVRDLRAAGYAIVVVTNQSGVARGYLTEDDVAAIHQRLEELLLAHGAGLDRVYYCPYLEGAEAVCPAYRRDSDLRKPRPGMLLLAARELGLDLSRSWMVGDSERDVQAGRAAGCRAILLGNGSVRTEAEYVSQDLSSAAEWILRGSDGGNPCSAPPAGPAAVAVDGDGAGPGSPPPARAARPGTDAAGSALDAILEEMRIARRERQHEEFSIGHLAGAVAQAFALCAIAWGIYAAINGADESAKIRLLAGIAFQLAALTWFTASRRRG